MIAQRMVNTHSTMTAATNIEKTAMNTFSTYVVSQGDAKLIP